MPDPPATATPEAAAHARPGLFSGWFTHVRVWLPQGRGLTEREWRIRHRAIVVIVLGHAVGLAIFGLMRGWPANYAIGEGLAIGALGVLAGLPFFSRSMRSGVAALALVLSSAVLTQFWGGVIEGHFHFFVIVALISLYQDWVPFLLAIAFVALDHGIVGTLAPQWVYNHPDALAHPWKWATVHATLVLAESVALVVVWRANEKSREETDRILRSADEGILGVDREGRVTFANPAAARMMKGKADAASSQGVHLQDILVQADGHAALAPDALRAKRAFQQEVILVQADGARLPVEMLCTPFEEGGEEGAVVALRDVSERHRVERERLQAREQLRELRSLQETSRFKAQFINTAAHELRTPLMPLRTEVHIMLNSKEDPAAGSRRKALELMQRNLERLSSLVDDLLTVARNDAGRLGLHVAPVPLRRLLGEVCDSFAALAKQKQITLRLDPCADVQVIADPQRVQQVLLNLVNNAFKFTPQGGRIGVSLRDLGTDVRVEIADNGLGLAAQDVPRLFRPFVQVHDTFQVTQPGSGLGLYICRQFVEMHGGRIEAESAGRTKGSTFWFTLPKNGPPPVKAPSEAAASADGPAIVAVGPGAGLADDWGDKDSEKGLNATVAEVA